MRDTIRAYEDRIRDLREYATEDGIDLSQESHDDFWHFVRANPGLRKGGIALRSNGDLRAVWRDGQGTRFGLQFLGDGEVEYLVFKKLGAGSEISRVMGQSTLEGVKLKIISFGLDSLLFL